MSVREMKVKGACDERKKGLDGDKERDGEIKGKADWRI